MLALLAVSFSSVRAVPAVCLGDCDGDGEVTIDEIIRGVNIALGLAALGTCPVFDTSGDGEVTVDELIVSVTNALNRCPEDPSPSPTSTLSPTTTATREIATATTTPSASATPTATGSPTVTATPTAMEPSATPTLELSPTPSQVNLATRAVGTFSSTTNILRALPSLFTLLLGNVAAEETGAGADRREMTFECLFGGGATLTCQRETEPQPGPPTFGLMFSDCVSIGAGGILTFDGSLSLVGQPTDTCASLPSVGHLTIGQLTLKAETDLSTATTTFSAIEADTNMSCSGGSCLCTYDRLDATIMGSIGFSSRDLSGTLITSATAAFAEGGQVSLLVEQTDELCEAIVYRSTITAQAAWTTDHGAQDLTFTDYRLSNDVSTGEDLLRIEGQLESGCFGAALMVGTREPLRIDRGAACPINGQLTVEDGLSTSRIAYGDSGVSIDHADDGSVDQTLLSCLDPLAFICPVL